VLQGDDLRLVLLDQVGGAGVIVERAGLVFSYPDADQHRAAKPSTVAGATDRHRASGAPKNKTAKLSPTFLGPERQFGFGSKTAPDIR
jgi:hypothetical protein